jgi:hypothetical protein
MSKPFARPAISKSVNLRNARYAYVSGCCAVLADKPSVADNDGALGKWRCSACRKRCKVSPTDKAKWMPSKEKVEPVQGEKA